MTLIETVDDVAGLEVADPDSLAFLTQTTLSVDDTAAIVEALQRRFPAIKAPRSEDICYATSNRQAAVKAIASECDRMLVIGAPNSSNSLRLAEVAAAPGRPCPADRAGEGHRLGLAGTAAGRVGVTAGASAPETLVREVVDALARAVPRDRGTGRPQPRAHDLQASARTRCLSLDDLPEVEMFTDGACRGNPGPGGWAALAAEPAKRSASFPAASR